MEYLRPDKIYEAVLSDRADLGLVSYPEGGPGSDGDSLARGAHVRGHVSCASVSRANDELSPRELAGEDFIAFDEDLSIRRQVDRFLREAGMEISVAMHFDNIQTIKEAVALGPGISILPDCTLQTEIEQGRLLAVPLREPGLVRPVGIVHRRRKKLTRAAQSFVELLEAREAVTA